jgi:hypothetical protein
VVIVEREKKKTGEDLEKILEHGNRKLAEVTDAGQKEHTVVHWIMSHRGQERYTHKLASSALWD